MWSVRHEVSKKDGEIFWAFLFAHSLQSFTLSMYETGLRSLRYAIPTKQPSIGGAH